MDRSRDVPSAGEQWRTTVASGGVVKQLLDQQEQWRTTLASGGVVKQLLDQQEQWRTTVASGGVVKQLLDQQEQWRTTLASGGVVKQLLDQQQQWRTTLTSGFVKQLLDQQEQWRTTLISGVVKQLPDQQEQWRTTLTSGVVKQLLDEQEQWSQQFDGPLIVAAQEAVRRDVSEAAENAIRAHQNDKLDTEVGPFPLSNKDSERLVAWLAFIIALIIVCFNLANLPIPTEVRDDLDATIAFAAAVNVQRSRGL